ncbi:MAG: hypothetical protein KF838_10190 [Phycisphaeraceae bacterium]|nr:MAG: hypothetical protein KF838_10190 [Phycisphaeraceae bacterium]
MLARGELMGEYLSRDVETDARCFVRTLVEPTPGESRVAGKPAVVAIASSDSDEVSAIEAACTGSGVVLRAASDLGHAARMAGESESAACLVVCRRSADGAIVPELAALRESGFQRPMIVVAERADAETVIACISATGVAFLIGPDAIRRLPAQIRAAHRKDAEQRQKAALSEDARNSIRKLTPREHEVLALMLRGNCNKQIAAELGLSVKTVETHRSRVLHKLGVDSIAEFAHLLLTMLT